MKRIRIFLALAVLAAILGLTAACTSAGGGGCGPGGCCRPERCDGCRAGTGCDCPK